MTDGSSCPTYPSPSEVVWVDAQRLVTLAGRFPLEGTLGLGARRTHRPDCCREEQQPREPRGQSHGQLHVGSFPPRPARDPPLGRGEPIAWVSRQRGRGLQTSPEPGRSGDPTCFPTHLLPAGERRRTGGIWVVRGAASCRLGIIRLHLGRRPTPDARCGVRAHRSAGPRARPQGRSRRTVRYRPDPSRCPMICRARR